MRIGSGAGDEFVEATLQLSGLKRGTEYVLCYWSASSNDLVGFSCSPGESYDDYELSVYGEQDVCLPDVPAISAADVRTLAWDSRSGIWRFQVKFESDGVGEASNIMATLATVPTDVVVLQAEAPIPDLGTGPPDTEAWAGASFVVDLSAYTLSAMFVGVEFGFENDCGRGSSSQTSFLLGAPGSYPVATPSAIEPVLGQNYPNPFNPQTILPLRMPTSGHASLRIYDVQGRLVRVLHEGMLAAGEHSMRWGGEDDRGRGVGAGVYLARFRAGPAAQVRRLVLIE
jgi:hypothetical protein